MLRLRSIRSIASSLEDALSAGDAKKAADLLTYEAVFEDRTARIKIVGKAAIERFLTRAPDRAPYGMGSRRDLDGGTSSAATRAAALNGSGHRMAP